ncbi:MAG: hypothetical protein GY717_08310, partial [Rhodobacteraceae bacterium]|nr:hypothetical protein [Paracoccaceae bacterium]
TCSDKPDHFNVSFAQAEYDQVKIDPSSYNHQQAEALSLQDPSTLTPEQQALAKAAAAINSYDANYDKTNHTDVGVDTNKEERTKIAIRMTEQFRDEGFISDVAANERLDKLKSGDTTKNYATWAVIANLSDFKKKSGYTLTFDEAQENHRAQTILNVPGVTSDAEGKQISDISSATEHEFSKSPEGQQSYDYNGGHTPPCFSA